LTLIDREFLRSDKKIVIPEHSLELDGTLVGVYLYGAYGADAESAVRAKLSDRASANRALEILIWLGSAGVAARGERRAIGRTELRDVQPRGIVHDASGRPRAETSC